MTQKAQAAVEFLVTYGWALIVILVLLGAFAFFGNFQMDFRRDYCILGAGFTCDEYEFTNERVYIKILGPGRPVTDITAELDCSPNYWDSTPGIPDKEGFTLEFDGYLDEAAKCNLVVKYRDAGSVYSKKCEGEVAYVHIPQGTPPVTENCAYIGDDDSDGCNDDTDSDCGHTEYSIGLCSNGEDDDCDGKTDCTPGNEDQSCLDEGECGLCENNELDLGESDTMDGLPPGWGGPWPSDCGGPDSGCPLCEDYRRCEDNADCLTNCCDKWMTVCGNPAGASPIFSKPLIECMD